MEEPGSGLPPKISNVGNTCSLTGISIVTFNINKIISNTTLTASVIRQVDDVVMWQDSFDGSTNARNFRVTNLPIGSYRIEGDNGEAVAITNFIVSCVSNGTCQITVTNPVATAAVASTGRGSFSFVANSIYAPFELTIIRDGLSTTRSVTTIQTGLNYLSNLLPGVYSLRVEDRQGCRSNTTFTIQPPAVYGCTSEGATNYNPAATQDDGSCIIPVVPRLGCTNPRASNYDPAATSDNGSCTFGDDSSAIYNYNTPATLTLVYSEPEQKWVSVQTSRPQMLLPIEGRHIHALPLPGESNESPARSSLWEHNAGLNVYHGVGTPYGVLLYGKRHRTWIEIILLGAGIHTIKNLDNLVIVSNDSLPDRLIVSPVEQGSFTQQLQYGNDHTTTCRREEQLTYVQLVPPDAKPFGGRIRAQYIRLRIEFQGLRSTRLSKLFALLRESVT